MPLLLGAAFDVEKTIYSRHYDDVSKIEKVEAELQKLSPQELQQVRDWLDDFVEDRMQFTAEFESAIGESEREMRSGAKPRVRKP